MIFFSRKFFQNDTTPYSATLSVERCYTAGAGLPPNKDALQYS